MYVNYIWQRCSGTDAPLHIAWLTQLDLTSQTELRSSVVLLINKGYYFLIPFIYPSLNASLGIGDGEGCEMVICAHKSVISAVMWYFSASPVHDPPFVTPAVGPHGRQASWPCMEVFTLPVPHRIYSVFSVLCCSTMYRSICEIHCEVWFW